MKKFFKLIAYIALICVAVLSLWACAPNDKTPDGDTTNTVTPTEPSDDPVTPSLPSYDDYWGKWEMMGPNDPVYSVTPTNPSDESAYPKDAGPFTTYRMESESAAHYQGNTEVTFNEITNLRFSLLYSGCLVTSNLSAVGTVHKFDFKSDKALGNVALVLNIAINRGNGAQISDMVNISVNGKSVNVRGLTINADNDCVCLDPFSSYGQYMYFKRVTVFVSIEKGDNEIAVEHISTTGGNLDYVELVTSAEITGFDNSVFRDNAATTWTVISEPTKTAEGKIKVTRGASSNEYPLPVLSESNGYSYDEASESYSFVLKGKTYGFSAVEEEPLPPDLGPFTAYRMEAESALHYDEAGTPVQFDENTHVRFSTLYSGCLVISNLVRYNNNSSAYSHEFAFESDKAFGGVTFAVSIAVNEGTSANVSDMIELYVNGKSVSLAGLTVSTSDNDCVCLDPYGSFAKYMYFKRISVPIDIKNGENKVVIKHVPSFGSGGNLDYIELLTSAAITGFDNDRFYDETEVTWTVTKNPTATATGTIQMKRGSTTRNYVLPKLAEGNGYTITQTDGGTEYSFMLKNEKYSFTI